MAISFFPFGLIQCWLINSFSAGGIDHRGSHRSAHRAVNTSEERTALHVACGKGHPEVVRLLASRRCLLNLCDIDNKTALIHAIQCEQEECATILLDHGADPNVMDIHGNTALHYAILGTSTAIVEKLLSCMANMEVRNKNDCTPLSLAKYENKEKMVQFLVTRGSKLHLMESNQQPTSKNKDKQHLEPSKSNNLVTRLQKSLKQIWSRRKSNKVCDISEEYSSCSKRRIAVSCPTSDNLILKVEEQKKTSGKREVSGNVHDGAEDNRDSAGVRKRSSTKQSDKQQLPLEENKDSDRNGSLDQSSGFYTKPVIGMVISCSTIDGEIVKVDGENKQTSSEKEVPRNTCAGAGDNSDRNGLRHQRDSEQTDTQKPNDKVNENTVFLMNKVEEKKEQKSSKKEETGNKYGAHHSDGDGLSQHSNSKETGNQQPNDIINENTVILMNKVEKNKEHSVGVRQKSNSKPSQKQQLPIMEKGVSDRNRFSNWCCGFYSKRRIGVAYSTSDNVIFKVEGENRQTRSKKEVSGNMYAVTNDDSDRNGLRHESNSEQTDTQQSNEKINENTVFLMNKVEEKKEQKSSKREESGNMFDVADDDTDSVGVRQKSNSEQSEKHQFPIVKNEDSDRSTLQKEKEKRRKADLFYPKNTAHLRKKEGQSMKAVEMNSEVENTIETQVMALKTVVEKQNYTQRQLSEEQKTSMLQDGILTKHPFKPKRIKVLSQISDSYEEEQSLIHENHILKDEIAKLTLELVTVKNQMQEMKKKYFEDIVIAKEKNDHLQKITETQLQHNEQFKVLRAELTKLSTKLEDKEQIRGRLEAEGDSDSSRRATVIQYHEHCQTSKGDLQVGFKKEKEEYFCSEGNKNSDISDLKHSIEILSQQLSKFESKFNHLEIELHSIRAALRDRTFVLQGGGGDQRQTQIQKKEIEQVYQQEQSKVAKDTRKQESLQEMISHLQNENKFLQKQLDQIHHKADKKIKITDQLADTIKILQANNEKQGRLLKETCKELINKWNLLKENTHQNENDKAERDAFVSHLQGELAYTQRKLSATKAQLKDESQHCMDSQRKIQALQMKLDETRSQAFVRHFQGELADTQRKLSATEALLKDESHHPMDSQYKIQALQMELDETRSQISGTFKHAKKEFQ